MRLLVERGCGEPADLQGVIGLENKAAALLDELMEVADFEVSPLAGFAAERCVGAVLIEDVVGDVLAEVDEDFVPERAGENGVGEGGAGE